jgi:hypothetical protein
LETAPQKGQGKEKREKEKFSKTVQEDKFWNVNENAFWISLVTSSAVSPVSVSPRTVTWFPILKCTQNKFASTHFLVTCLCLCAPLERTRFPLWLSLSLD